MRSLSYAGDGASFPAVAPLPAWHFERINLRFVSAFQMLHKTHKRPPGEIWALLIHLKIKFLTRLSIEKNTS